MNWRTKLKQADQGVDPEVLEKAANMIAQFYFKHQHEIRQEV